MSSTGTDADSGDVTDHSGVIRDWRLVLAAGVAVLSAAVVTLVVRTGDPATADTYVVSAVNAAVVLADGRTVDAVPGARVPEGAVLRTGTCGTAGAPRACGAAQLRTAGRDVYLGADSALLVVDGVHQSLSRGLAMVDSRGGARLDLSTRAGILTVGEGALVRVELGTLFLRAGTFNGDVRLAALGRQVTTSVPALHQVRVPYVGLPLAPTVLTLTGDAWEERLAGPLVAADRDLVRLAAALRGTQGWTVLAVAPAALRVESVATGDVGESALAVAVADAAQADGSPAQRLAEVRQSRDEGGSWGVVAALVAAHVADVSRVLDGWLDEPEGSGPVDAAGNPDLGVLLGSPQPTPAPSAVRPTGAGPTPTTSASPTSTPTATSSSSPPTVVGGLVNVVGDLLTAVTELLLPAPSPSGSPTSPIPGVDGGVIGVR